MATRRTGLLDRKGRFYARKIIPIDLRRFFDGKSELLKPLGPDRREANAKLTIVMADFEMRLAAAKRKAKGDDIEREIGVRANYPLNDDQMAVTHYAMELDLDARERTFGDRSIIVGKAFNNPISRQLLIRSASGIADNDEMGATIGWAIDAFAERGNHSYRRGSKEWRKLAMELAAAQLETIGRQIERDEGIFDGQPRHPTLVAANLEAAKAEPISIKKLFADFIKDREALGKNNETARRWKSVFRDLVKFLGHDDASRITRKDIIAWKDHLIASGLALRTVRYANIAAVNAVFNWARDADKMETNPAERVKVNVPKPVRNREKGFRDDEALAILKATKEHRPRKSELQNTSDARRWIPLLSAFSGARVGELMQLRKQDIFERDGIKALLITPDAGSVKTNQYRNVPLHSQIIDEGFIDWVATKPDGYLFMTLRKGQDIKTKNASCQCRLRDWLRSQNLAPQDVSPTHGWRHRFKTVGRELGLDGRVLDAIQGHAGRTAGDEYGDVTLKAMNTALAKVPKFDLG